VTASHSNVFAIREDGVLFSMGRNVAFEGQLGRGANPGLLNTLQSVTTTHTDWTYISASRDHVLALRENGQLWAWGSNGQGQLGTGHTANSTVPIQVFGAVFYRIGAGSNFSVGINAAGGLLTWGGNNHGQLGIGIAGTANTLIPTVRNINIGSQTWSFVRMGQTSHVLAVTSGGEIWSWGGNGFGQVGTGDNTGPVLTPARRENFRDVDGNTITVGRFVTSIAGGSFSFAIQEDGRMFGWGHNTYGTLGLGFFLPADGFVGNPTLVLPQP